MPSLRHEVLARVVPRLRGSGEIRDVEAARALRLRANREPRHLPTRVTPRLARDFTHDIERVGSGTTAFDVHVLTPRVAPARRTLLHVHGGGYAKPIDEFHVRFTTRLAARIGARVVLPDYPLAPEFTWADSFDTMHALASRWASEPGGIILSGDSAGGGYALALAQQMREAGATPATHLLLQAPWLDLSASVPGTAEVERDDPWLFAGQMAEWASWWAPDPGDLTRPEVSPLFGELAGLPRALLQIGTRDTLMPACRELGRRARPSGWDLSVVEEPGAVHVYPLLPFLPEATRALEQSVYFLKS